MEQFSNEGSAVLDGGINNSVTSITVKSPIRVPATGTFRARIDDEYIKVTAVSGNTWTVARNDGGSSAASHSDNAPINLVVTREAVDAIVSVRQSGSEVANRRALNFLGATVADDAVNGQATITISSGPVDEVAFTTPPASNTLTWVNQGTATVSNNSYGGWHLNAPAVGASDNNRMLVTSIPGTTPWSFIVRLNVLTLSVNYTDAGMTIRESSTGKFYRLGFGVSGVVVDRWSGPTSFASNEMSPTAISHGTPIRWGKISYDGTNIVFSVSHDGLNWMQLRSVGKTSYFTSGPDQVGVVANANQASGGLSCGVSVLSWFLG